MHATAPPAAPASQYEVLTGVFSRECWRPKDYQTTGNLFVLGSLEDGTTVLGDVEPGDLICGMTYRFFGKYEAPKKAKPGQRQYGNGKQFKFRNFTKAEPLSRHGLVNYLARYAPGVGPGIAARLHDAYGSDACRTLRTDPARAAAEIRGLTLEKAKIAAEALQALAATEDIKIELVNLFAGRGFPAKMADECVKKWGVLAPKRISRDPFILLLSDLPGAGFSRCDRLYGDLGLNPRKTRRQMICLWHAITGDLDGHTWFSWSTCEVKLRQAIAGADPSMQKAVALGVKIGRLAVKVDGRGQRWIANATSAKAEQRIASNLVRLVRQPVVLPLFTVALPGECDNSDTEYNREAMELLAGMEDLPDSVEHWKLPGLLKIGRETGICQICGRALVNPESLARGIGPVCAERMGMMGAAQ